MLIYIIICETECQDIFQKNYGKMTKKYQMMWMQEKRIHIYGKKGNNENENTEKCGFHGDDMIGKQVGAERVYDFTEKEKRTLCCYAKECGWEITLPQNHRYTYCIVDRIDFTEEWEYILTEITPPFKNLNKKLMNRFQQYIVDLFTKFCAELEAAGYHFFYSIDDEAIKNVCDINEWMFLEDGTLFSA